MVIWIGFWFGLVGGGVSLRFEFWLGLACFYMIWCESWLLGCLGLVFRCVLGVGLGCCCGLVWRAAWFCLIVCLYYLEVGCFGWLASDGFAALVGSRLCDFGWLAVRCCVFLILIWWFGTLVALAFGMVVVCCCSGLH